MIVRICSVLLLTWLGGFIWFAVSLPQPLDGTKTDGIVVLTGGAGRIDRGLEMMEQGTARRMLISGVDHDVRPGELAVAYKIPPNLISCCITLGREAIDTRSNAIETARWIARRRYHSLRLITSDWHMRRAAFELDQALPDTVAIRFDAVPTRPSLTVLVLEYDKYLLRRAAALVGV